MNALLTTSNNSGITGSMTLATLNIDSNSYRVGNTYAEVFSISNEITKFRFIFGFIRSNTFSAPIVSSEIGFNDSLAVSSLSLSSSQTITGAPTTVINFIIEIRNGMINFRINVAGGTHIPDRISMVLMLI